MAKAGSLFRCATCLLVVSPCEGFGLGSGESDRIPQSLVRSVEGERDERIGICRANTCCLGSERRCRSHNRWTQRSQSWMGGCEGTRVRLRVATIRSLLRYAWIGSGNLSRSTTILWVVHLLLCREVGIAWKVAFVGRYRYHDRLLRVGEYEGTFRSAVSDGGRGCRLSPIEIRWP